MALIQTVQASDLYNMACAMNRGSTFGYDGWLAIGDYLEELSTDKNIEIDIVAICCDYNHAESAQEVFDQYDTNIDPTEWEEMEESEKYDAILDYLNENTSVVCCEDGCIIWAAF